MRIVAVEPGKKPEVRDIQPSLDAMQEVVGGLIQCLYPFAERVALVCNDEGKLLDLPMNRELRDDTGWIYDIIQGTFFICGLSEEDFDSLTDEQIQYYSQMFEVPKMFIRIDGKIFVLPMPETNSTEEDNE